MTARIACALYALAALLLGWRSYRSGCLSTRGQPPGGWSCSGAGLVRKGLTADDIAGALDTSYDLCLQVHDRAGFRWPAFDPTIFQELKAPLGQALSCEAF